MNVSLNVDEFEVEFIDFEGNPLLMKETGDEFDAYWKMMGGKMRILLTCSQ